MRRKVCEGLVQLSRRAHLPPQSPSAHRAHAEDMRCIPRMTRCLLRMFTDLTLADRSSYLSSDWPSDSLLPLRTRSEANARRTRMEVTHHPCSNLPFGLRCDTTARIFLLCTTGVSLALDQVSESVSCLGEDRASIATLASSVARMRSSTMSMGAVTVCDIPTGDLLS